MNCVASAFYGLTPILIPQQQSLDTLAGIPVETKADILVASAGTLPLKELLPKYPNLKQVIWVVERTSRHMDWNEVGEGEGGIAEVAVWHDIIDEKQTSSELPSEIPGGTTTNVVMVTEDAWSAMDSYELSEFTQAVRHTDPLLTMDPPLTTACLEHRSSNRCPDLRPPTPPPARSQRYRHTPCLSRRDVSLDHHTRRSFLQRHCRPHFCQRS